MTREEIKSLIEKAIKELQKEGVFLNFEVPEIKIEQPEEKTHGDYSTNIALALAKAIKKDPMEMAERIKAEIQSEILEKIEVAKPGFINFFISKDYLQNQIEEILQQGKDFGKVRPVKSLQGKFNRVNVEFISANPTGPLHIGNARGGFCGNVLANILEKAGYKIFREYYVNDTGKQIEILQNSLEGKEPAYPGAHIEDLKKRNIKDAKEATKIILKEYIEPTVKKMGIKFDQWFFESDLYNKKEVEKAFDFLKKKNLTYEKEGATWFKSSEFGDDKDRVLVKKDDKETYFLSDVAYLKNKFERGFDYLIIFLGAEHHGYTSRLKAAAEALGYNRDKVRPIIMQLVRLLEKGKELKMSKRTGTYITIDELLEEVGPDVSKFFFLVRGYGSHLLFDLDLAKEQSEKNPVFYIQYAHARICSILRKAKDYKPKGANVGLLSDLSELGLIKQLIRLPEIVEDTAKDYQVQRIPQYALDLVRTFHKFYEECRVIDEKNQDLTNVRLVLVWATQIVLKNTLDLMGISAPEKM